MDLLYHFIAGAVISILIMLIFGKRDPITHLRSDWVKAIAGIFPLLVGLGKEAIDLWWGTGNPEIADVTLTWGGGIFGVVVILFIDLFRTDKY